MSASACPAPSHPSILTFGIVEPTPGPLLLQRIAVSGSIRRKLVDENAIRR
jgi:hypothetical protein